MVQRVDYATGVVTVRVPRGCLGDPRLVRVVSNSFWETSSRQFKDNPHSDDPVPAGFTRRLYRP